MFKDTVKCFSVFLQQNPSLLLTNKVYNLFSMLMFEEWLYESPVVYILTSVALTSLPQNNLSFSISRNSETLENTKKLKLRRKQRK